MIPAAAYLIFSEQTRRLCLPDGTSEETRRLIRKLVLHFTASRLPESVRRVAEANLVAVDPTCPETYALRCLAAMARIVREAERDARMYATLDLLPGMDKKIREITEMLTGGQQ